jgi:hypothetical protein
LQHAGRLDAGVGHDQRLADAHALAFLAQQLHGAKVELDLGDVVDESHVGNRSKANQNGKRFNVGRGRGAAKL